ncbi:MAG: hypothetical protein CMP11_02965 [Zetaproteobacteria bacterium]|nr:hypothetical protein [Pseudobdellovibrionaceae bacterium]|tara:strand:- start:3468 stop:4577 length:1110 start_codon:yes stop_codon:yes gene_type:complete
MSFISAKEMSEYHRSLFLKPKLQSANAYHIEPSQNYIKLDQNELPFDWPDDLKNKVLKSLKEKQWNRYPEPYSLELEKLVANYAGINEKNILLSPGSNYHITVVINMLMRVNKNAKLVIANPSFPLYEGHCLYEGIEFERWELDKNFQYDLKKLPELPRGSVLIFASPNNPTGSFLPKNDLKSLLNQYPDVFFVADEAYYEFSSEPYTDLLKDHSNLLILRTFSKAFCAAGVRLAYTAGSQVFIDNLRKLTLPFLLNYFSLVAMKHALKHKKFLYSLRSYVYFIIEERKKLYKALGENSLKFAYKVYPSSANFLLLTWQDETKYNNFFQDLKRSGVLVRPVFCSSACFALRISIGREEENKVVHDYLSR